MPLDNEKEPENQELDTDEDLEIDVSFDQNQAVICCRILASLMMTDNNFSEREQLFLSNTMTLLGLKEDERQAASQPMALPDIEAIVPNLDQDVKKALLDALFQVALVDGHLASEEMRYINHIRRLLTASPDAKAEEK